ncbi:hypothetical protein [Micromonospora sp. NPDC005299]|uniref:hypothetical protein n=1 Tax=Micromonospora sp. NPDC005299 TaxID=3364231 RepID=UPI003673DE7B
MGAAVRRTLLCSLLAGSLAVSPGGVSAAAAAQTGVSAASATLAGYPVWAHLSDPTAGRDYTILAELQRLIDATPAGATIRAAIHSLSVDSVADALVRAQTRGVAGRPIAPVTLHRGRRGCASGRLSERAHHGLWPSARQAPASRARLAAASH